MPVSARRRSSLAARSTERRRLSVRVEQVAADQHDVHLALDGHVDRPLERRELPLALLRAPPGRGPRGAHRGERRPCAAGAAWAGLPPGLSRSVPSPSAGLSQRRSGMFDSPYQAAGIVRPTRALGIGQASTARSAGGADPATLVRFRTTGGRLPNSNPVRPSQGPRQSTWDARRPVTPAPRLCFVLPRCPGRDRCTADSDRCPWGGRLVSYIDRTLTCLDCGVEFIHSAADQEFYAQKGFVSDPKRCPSCRASRRADARDERLRRPRDRRPARLRARRLPAAARVLRGDLLQVRQRGAGAVQAAQGQAGLLLRLLPRCRPS